MADFKTEFPDYPEADMPPLPEGFTDTSWHNDAMPSYSSPSFQIMIDYVDENLREYHGMRRFLVIDTSDNESETVLESDDWSEVLEFVVDEATIQSVCAKQGISVIKDDSVPRAGRIYHVMQGDHRLKMLYSEFEVRDFILSRKDAT